MNIQEIYDALSNEDRVRFAKANQEALGIARGDDLNGYTLEELFAELKKRELYEVIDSLDTAGVRLNQVRGWAETE